MNILFDYQIFSMQQYGGVSRYFYEISNRIAALPENNIEIFAPLYVNEYFRSNGRVCPRGIKIRPLPSLSRIIGMVNHYSSRLLVKSRHNVDIFHETYYSMADYCPATARRVITVYDMIHEKFAEYFSNAAYDQHVKSHAVRRADHVICISENTKRDLMELLSVPEHKISVAYLGYSLEPKEGKKAILTARRKPYLLYVGYRQGYKNFDRLLRAYANSSLLKNKFDIVCFGGDDFSSSEVALMQSLGISTENITHLGGSDDLLAGLYVSAAAFVYPSLYEGFGMPLLEAMSLGCPVVCANTSSIPEVAGDAAALFDPYNETAMQSAIERVVSLPDHAATLVERGRRRVNLFSWDKCAQDTLDVYRKVLEA
jgi:glycosyltransferase involved in cell wall biosynthesis